MAGTNRDFSFTFFFTVETDFSASGVGNSHVSSLNHHPFDINKGRNYMVEYMAVTLQINVEYQKERKFVFGQLFFFLTTLLGN